tara:strand:+ start:196 stop:516 length:321 start_codon:yes stop_codon:yes gene_type:complete
MKTKEPYIPSNGTDGALFEEFHCWNCANYVHIKNLDGEDCNKGLLSKAWWEGKAPKWYEIWEDGEPKQTGCEEFVDKSLRSDRAKQAHKTMQENQFNDLRQLKLFT